LRGPRVRRPACDAFALSLYEWTNPQPVVVSSSSFGYVNAVVVSPTICAGRPRTSPPSSPGHSPKVPRYLMTFHCTRDRDGQPSGQSALA
jgi:hypothetical protein